MIDLSPVEDFHASSHCTSASTIEGLAGEGHRLLAGVVGTADRAVEVHVLDFAQGRKFFGDLLGGVLLAEAYDVP